MSVTIRKMTPEEFDCFYAWSAEQQAQELTEELGLSRKDAAQQAAQELSQLLSRGIHTEGHDLMAVVADSKTVGFIWTLYEECDGEKQVFLCDFAIWENFRRKGYAKIALSFAEQSAAKAGCEKIVLFVRDSNIAARALYEKCGYQPLRQKSYGIFMAKPLTPAL